MTASMQAAVEIADRMTTLTPEYVEQPRSYVISLRYTYGSKKRKANRLASQAKGVYEVNAKMQTNSPFTCFVLARGPQKAIAMALEAYSKGRGLTNLTAKRICGITAGTKERIL